MRISAAGCRLAAGFVGALVWSASVFASYTPIFPPNGEETHAAILSYIYGGSFTPTGILNLSYTNGTITATRIEDTIDQNPTIAASRVVNGGGDDQLWLADYTVASARAKYAVYKQEFGYFDGPSGNNYVKLFDQTGWGYNVGGSADLSALAGHLLRWGRGGEDRVWSSDPETNPDGLDHMVTYRIDDNRTTTERGVPGAITTWLLFWEDKYPPLNTARNHEPDADFDFNDLVVELKAIAGAPIPEPTSAALCLLPALALIRRPGRD